MTRKTYRFGWIVAIVMLTALACTCGNLGQATEAIQTAQYLGTEAQQLATQAESLGTVEAGATELVIGDVAEDIPIFEDHENLAAISGSVGYQTSADLNTVLDFYQTEMVNNGWTESQPAIVTAEAAVLNYEKDGRTASISIGATGGTTAVGIQYTP